jgi:hypothetical protein
MCTLTEMMMPPTCRNTVEITGCLVKVQAHETQDPFLGTAAFPADGVDAAKLGNPKILGV